MSQEASYTPGPWSAEQLKQSRRWQVVGSVCETSALIVCDLVRVDKAAEADARLIAAAPELLESCKDAQHLIEQVSLWIGDRSITDAQARVGVQKLLHDCGLATAIAKAQGGVE